LGEKGVGGGAYESRGGNEVRRRAMGILLDGIEYCSRERKGGAYPGGGGAEIEKNGGQRQAGRGVPVLLFRGVMGDSRRVPQGGLIGGSDILDG